MSEQTKLVKPENKLKKKVGNGGFKESDLIKAQSMIENNTIDFKPIAIGLLAELKAALSEVELGKTKGKEALGQILYPLMQLRAQGSLFHYPVITSISDIIVDFLDGVGVLDDDVVEIVVGYQKSLQAILTLGIKDDANPVGKDLRKALTEACQRYKKFRVAK